MTIVTTRYRNKRPPRKKPKSAAIEGPRIITNLDKKQRRSVADATTLPKAGAVTAPVTAAPPANDDRKEAVVTLGSDPTIEICCDTPVSWVQNVSTRKRFPGMPPR